MKDSESIVRSNKRANSRTLVGAKLKNSSSLSSSRKSNGTTATAKSPSDKKRTQKAKAMMGASNSKTPTKANNKDNNSNNSSGSKKRNGSPKKGSKQSPESRPRRRASQTYFFKYQLAKNPLKAEEEDLKLALLASLQQCPNDETSDTGIKNKSSNSVKKTKQSKNSIQSTGESKKQHARRPSKSSDDLSSNEQETTTNNSKKKERSSPSKKGQHYKICANYTNGNKRRGSVESNSSSIGSSLRDDEKKTKQKQNNDLLTDCSLKSTKSKKSKSKVKNSLSTCNDLTSVQNKIKKAKKFLQNKQANKNNSNAIIGKYSALRKFPSNSSNIKRQGGNSMFTTDINDKSKGKSKFNGFYYRNHNSNDYNHNAHLSSSTANFNTTSRNQYFIPYSPYTPLQKKEPPDEDYLKKYKPETEDFLTFICFRTTAPNYQNRPTSELVTNGFGDDTNSTTTTIITNNQGTSNNRINDKLMSNDTHNLNQRPTSPSKTTNNINGSPTIDFRYKIHRPPTRSSPRLASSSKKISEKEGLFHSLGTSNTACDNSMTYEEDMKRASIALEDMAQEINSSDGIKNEIAQDSPDCISKSSTSPYKNNKHLVKGLMTREFAGAFADEETIFESISNHKL